MSLRNTIGRTANLVEVRAPGSQGAAGATWRGTWAAGVTYNQNDLVRYLANGNLYFHSNATASLSADPSNLPTNTSNWDLFAAIQDAEGWSNTIRHTTYTDISGLSLTDETPTPSAAWEVSKSHTGVSQTSTSGSGTGILFSITTDTAGNPYFTVTNVGSGYALTNTIVVTDPGSTSSTATVTVNSLTGDTGYSSKHSKFQARDWGFKTDGFVPKEVNSLNADDKPNINTTTNKITFDAFTDTAGGESLAIAHGFSKDDPIRFRIVANATYGSPAMPTASPAFNATTLYYVLSVSGNDITISTSVDGAVVNVSNIGTGTLVALDDYSAKAWAVGGTYVTTTAGAGAAKEWATTTGGAVDTVEHSSKAWAIGGTGITDTASHGAAKEWAIETSGNVDGTSFSAKEYSQGTQGSTGGSAKNWATQTAADVTGASSGDMSSKEWSVGTLGRTVSGEGSAKDWATYVGGTADNAGHSAKAWAVGGTGVTDTSGKGSAKEWATEAEDNTVDTSGYSALHHATKAAASQLAAKASAAAVAAAFDSFDDKYLGVMPDRVFTASSDSGLKLTDVAHGLVLNDVIRVTSSAGSPDLPDGLAVNTNYFVISGGLTANVFYLSTSEGGSAIAWSDAGSGTHTWYFGTSLASGITGTWAQHSSVITVSNDSGIRIGQEAAGSGIPTHANVIAISGNNITISENMAAAGSSVAVTFISYGILGLYDLSKDGPGLNNDGDALSAGLLHFNNTDDEMRIYDGSNWIPASAAGSTSLVVHKFVASGSETSVVASSFTPTLSYTPASIIVFLNGVALDSTAYTATNSADITGLSSLSASDKLVVYAFKSFTVADTVSAASGGTFSGDVSIINTKKLKQLGAFMQSSTHQALFLGV